MAGSTLLTIAYQNDMIKSGIKCRLVNDDKDIR